MNSRRVFLTVLDACGIGAMPDAAEFHDPPGADTIGNVARAVGGLSLPNLARLGLCELLTVAGTHKPSLVDGSFARVALASPGKDTITGHWEICGIILEQPFDLFPQGFPATLIDRIITETGCGGVLANSACSGTVVIREYDEAHAATAHPIVYTSADSVLQVAARVDLVAIDRLYSWCETIRGILNSEYNVARVIARPYCIQDGRPTRIQKQRCDFAVKPPRNLLHQIVASGGQVFAVGKIENIFLGEGISFSRSTGSNTDGIVAITDAIRGTFETDAGETVEVNGNCPQLVFANLVDTDSLYGHRNDPEGFARALESIDQFIGDALEHLRDDDLFVVVADHGCDPTVPGTNHTREYVPYLAWSRSLPSGNLGKFSSLARTGQLVQEWLSKPTGRHGNDRSASCT